MSLSPGYKRGDTFNFYLHKSITQWEPRAHAHNLKFQQTSEKNSWVPLRQPTH